MEYGGAAPGRRKRLSEAQQVASLAGAKLKEKPAMHDAAIGLGFFLMGFSACGFLVFFKVIKL